MKKLMTMMVVFAMAFVAVAAQCMATTKKGTQCKRQASPGSQYCWQHGGQTKAQIAAGAPATRPATRSKTGTMEQTTPAAVSGMCQGKTKAGKPCSRKASPGSNFCWQHGGQAAAAPVATPAAEKTKKVKASAKSAEKEAKSAPVNAADAAGGDGLCAAMKADGSRCTRKAKPGTKYCWQHTK